MSDTDRYVLRGLESPIIGPGKLEYLNRFLKIAYESSMKFPDKSFWIEAVTGKERTVIRRYKGGEDISEF